MIDDINFTQVDNSDVFHDIIVRPKKWRMFPHIIGKTAQSVRSQLCSIFRF